MARPRSQTIGSIGRSPARREAPKPATPIQPLKVPEGPQKPEPGAIRAWIRSALFDNVGLKFLSMVLAITVFLLVNTDKDREITVRVGLNYEHPAGKVLVSQPVDEVRVTLKGQWRQLKRFDERAIDRIRLDMTKSDEVTISPDMIADLPAGITVTSISPRTLSVAYDREVEKLVEIEPTTAGHAEHGYRVAELRVTPATVKVRGAERALSTLSNVDTTPVSIERAKDTFDAPAKLALPDGVKLAGAAPSLAVQVRIEEALATRKQQLLVDIRGAETQFRISPNQVELSFTGTVRAIDEMRFKVKPFVRLAPNDTRTEVKVELEGVRPGVGVVIIPELVNVTRAPGGDRPPLPK